MSTATYIYSRGRTAYNLCLKYRVANAAKKMGNDENPGETVLSGVDWFSLGKMLLFSPGLISFTAANDRPRSGPSASMDSTQWVLWEIASILYETSNLRRRVPLPSS